MSAEKPLQMPDPPLLHAMAAVHRERTSDSNADIIPSWKLRTMVNLLYDEVIRQRSYIEQLHAQRDAQ